MTKTISYSERQLEQFSEYSCMLIQWNERMNLTRITEPKDIELYHFADSLEAIRHFSFEGKSLIDIGTGAGFPGIPLKIMNPGMELTLLDALDKRCMFLREVVKALGLNGVTVIHGRAEDFASVEKKENSLRESFDFATSRAVAKLNILCEYAIPFLKTGGVFIAYKLDDIPGEICAASSALSILNASLKSTLQYKLKEDEPLRALYVIHKDGSTPDKYPRRAGLPERRPL